MSSIDWFKKDFTFQEIKEEFKISEKNLNESCVIGFVVQKNYQSENKHETFCKSDEDDSFIKKKSEKKNLDRCWSNSYKREGGDIIITVEGWKVVDENELDKYLGKEVKNILFCCDEVKEFKPIKTDKESLFKNFCEKNIDPYVMKVTKQIPTIGWNEKRFNRLTK